MKTHRTDLASLLVGLFFVAIGTVALVGEIDVVDLRFDYLGPALLIAGGLAVLLTTVGRRDDDDQPSSAPTETASRGDAATLTDAAPSEPASSSAAWDDPAWPEPTQPEATDDRSSG